MAGRAWVWAAGLALLAGLCSSQAWAVKPAPSNRPAKAEPSDPLDRPEGFYGVVRRVDEAKGELLIEQEMSEGSIRRVAKIYRLSPDALSSAKGIKAGDRVAFMLMPGIGVASLMGIVKLDQAGW